MSTLQLTISSDEEDNVTSTKVTENDNDVTSDEEEEDGMNDDFEFGGLMVRVVCYIW
jgi:hypothetical protein